MARLCVAEKSEVGGWNLYQKIERWIWEVEMRMCAALREMRPSRPNDEPRVDHLEMLPTSGTGQCVMGS